jgi:hypothetical protein
VGLFPRGLGFRHLNIITRPHLVRALRMLRAIPPNLLWFHGMQKDDFIFVPHLPFHIGDFLENKAHIGSLPFSPIRWFYKKHNHFFR